MAVFAQDDLNDVDATLLDAHTACSSGTHTASLTWTKHGSYAGDAEFAGTDKVRAQDANSRALYYASPDPADADYDVEVDATYVTAAGSTGVAGRIATAAQTLYQFFWAGGDWVLDKVVAGVTTNLLTAATPDPTAGNTWKLKLMMRGTTISAWIDSGSGYTQLGTDVSDSAISAAGKAGVTFYLFAAPTDANGTHLSNFIATDTAGGGGGTAVKDIIGAGLIAFPR